MMRPMKKDPMAMMMRLGGMLRKKKEEGMAYGGHGMMVPGDEKVKIVMKMPGGGMVRNAMNYRKGGMIYAENGDELPGMSKVREIALGDPRGQRGQAAQTSSMFFGTFPGQETEEEETTQGMRPVKTQEGVNMLPEVEVVGSREQPQKEQTKKRIHRPDLVEGDPNEMVKLRDADGNLSDISIAQLNQLKVDKYNKAIEGTDQERMEDILPEEKRFGYKEPEVMQLPLSPDRLLQKYMRGQLDDLYENDPDTRRIVNRAMKEFEDRGGKFRDEMTRSDLFTSGVGNRPEIYKPGYGFSEEELAEMIPRYAAIAKEQGKVLPPGFERFLTQE